MSANGIVGFAAGLFAAIGLIELAMALAAKTVQRRQGLSRAAIATMSVGALWLLAGAAARGLGGDALLACVLMLLFGSCVCFRPRVVRRERRRIAPAR